MRDDERRGVNLKILFGKHNITMKRYIFMAMVIALCGCGGHNHEHEAVHEHNHIHGFTAYTHNLEMFLQHEGLEQGKKSCITLYVTDLSSFKPAKAELAEAVLKAGEKSVGMKAEAKNPGVFHFDFTPNFAGHALLYIDVAGEKAHFDVEVNAHSHVNCSGHSHDHGHDHAHNHEAEHSHGHDHAGHGNVHSHAHSHSHAPHPGHGVATDGKEGDVSFTKEQSWKIDFATAVAAKSSFGGEVKVVARAESQPGNFTTLVATASGKVCFAGNVVAGRKVKADEPLFYLESGDVTDNDAAVKYAEAESNYYVAKSDFERKKHLFIDKIVSEREYQAAEALYRQSEARFQSMQRSFGDGKVTLRSSMDGYVSAMHVANGDYLEPGTPLATIQCDGGLNIVAELPVRYASMLQNIDNVNVELASGEVYSLAELDGTVLAVGSSVNSCNMIPVTLSLKKAVGIVPGTIVTLYLTSSAGEQSVVVPRTAIVEEMGNFFVFVQNSPVSFEKRSVQLGATDGKLVKVLSGVHAGERVVTKGGIVLKLSQGAAALDPHAGHVH